ncbi:MAG: response regulator transcription factor [Anaerolineae bacterium]
MSSAEIIVADDQPEICTLVAQILRHDGYTVRTASCGREALEMVLERTPKLLILDIMMPDIDGLTLCRRLRDEYKYNNLPILFLTALAKTNQVVDGLNGGADDYMTKPFEAKELIARVRAQLRRSRSDVSMGSALLRMGDMVLDGKAYEVRTSNIVARLTATEYRLLRYMADRPNQVITYSDLLQAVWSYPPDSGDPDLVRTHVRNIRAKIESDPIAKRYLQTVHGIGYMFKVPGPDAVRIPSR